MGRFSFHEGVIFNGSAAVIASAGGLKAVTATDTAGLILGWAGIILGIGLFVWGFKIDREHWWRRLPTPRWPRFSRGQMYIGQILAFDSELDARHTLSVCVRGYNGTGRDRLFLGVSGCIGLTCILNGTGPQDLKMTPPGLVDPPKLIPADTEFNINFQQPLTPEQVALFRQWEGQGADIKLAFGELCITTKARFSAPEKLILWDGITLRNGRFLGKIINVSMQDTVHVAARWG